MRLSYHNSRGQIVTFPLVAEFHDEDGRVFFVVGPVPQGDPPYVIVPKDAGCWRHDTDIDLKIENAIGGLRNYGYRVTVKPVPGQEQECYESLRDGLRKIDAAVERYRRHFRIRGTNTKRIREMLWRDIPEPCWGVTAPDE